MNTKQGSECGTEQQPWLWLGSGLAGQLVAVWARGTSAPGTARLSWSHSAPACLCDCHSSSTHLPRASNAAGNSV